MTKVSAYCLLAPNMVRPIFSSSKTMPLFLLQVSQGKVTWAFCDSLSKDIKHCPVYFPKPVQSFQSFQGMLIHTPGNYSLLAQSYKQIQISHTGISCRRKERNVMFETTVILTLSIHLTARGRQQKNHGALLCLLKISLNAQRFLLKSVKKTLK